MKILIALFTCTLLCAGEVIPFPNPNTYEEALFLRRMASFWEEGEKETVCRQVKEYVEENPDTLLSDAFRLFLGEQALEAKDYLAAEKYFREIKDLDYSKKAFLKRLECLQTLKWYNALVGICEKNIQRFKDEPGIYNKAVYLLGDAYTQLAMRSPEGSEDQYEYAASAKSYFLSLQDTPFQPHTLFALAFLHKMLNEPQQAASLYLQLADKNQDERHEMLFQAGQMQMQFDKQAAVQTFAQVCHVGKKRAPTAALNRMMLLFELKKYPEIILAKEQFFSYIDKNKKDLVHFIVGKSYFHLEDYNRAYPELKSALSQPLSLDAASLENLCISLLDCAQKLKDVDGFDQYLEELIKSSPKTPYLIKAKTAQAMLYKAKKNYSRAIQLFDYLFDNYPETQNDPLAIFEYSHALFLAKRWNAARDGFDRYLSLKGDDALAFHFYLQAMLEYIKTDPNEKNLMDLVDHLERAIASPVFTDQEKKDYRYFLAKSYYDLADYTNAIAVGEDLLLEKDLSDSLKSNALLLVAYSHDQINDKTQFCLYAEKAIKDVPSHPHISTLHVHLFNAYLDRGMMDLAAGHLYFAFKKGKAISLSNQFWLASFYYEQIKTYAEENPGDDINLNKNAIAVSKRAIHLWEDIFDKFPTFHDEEGLSLEADLLNCAHLHGLMKQEAKQISLLERLIQTYEKYPDKKWALQEKAKFDLANAYLAYGKEEKATPRLKELCKEKKYRSYFQAFSGWQLAKIYIKKGKEQASRDQALALLKDLTLQKNLLNEPIHLEAAFDYIELTSSFERDKKEMSKRLALLAKTKKNFVDIDDVPSKDYHAAKEQHPEKATLFSAYLDLFDLEMILCEIVLAQSADNPEKVIELKEQAEKIVGLWNDYPLNPYFDKRMAASVKRLERVIKEMPEKNRI